MIETERLVLRRPRAEDAADLAVAYADPEVVRFIGDGGTASLAEVQEGIGAWLMSNLLRDGTTRCLVHPLSCRGYVFAPIFSTA